MDFMYLLYSETGLYGTTLKIEYINDHSVIISTAFIDGSVRWSSFKQLSP